MDCNYLVGLVIILSWKFITSVTNNLKPLIRDLIMKNTTQRLALLASLLGGLSLVACNSGSTASQTGTSQLATTAAIAATTVTSDCLSINVNSLNPRSTTQNKLMLTVQNNCSVPLDLSKQTIAFVSQDTARTPVNAPTKFTGSGYDQSYTLNFNAVDPQTGFVNSKKATNFVLQPQQGIMLTGTGKLDGVAYDWYSANASAQPRLKGVNPLADTCLKAHFMVDNPDATGTETNTATIYLENTCNAKKSLKGKEITLVSQDMLNQQLGVPELTSPADASGKTYSMTLDQNVRYSFVSSEITPNLTLPAHQGITLSGDFSLHGFAYDFFTAERTIIVRDIPTAQ